MDIQLKYAWAAGFIDADGTITIKRQRHGREKKFNYVPYIAVSQKDCIRGNLAVNLLKEMFKGNIYKWTATQNMKLFDGTTITAYKRNNTVNWQTTSTASIECLKKILPYLVAKKRQGALLKKFYDDCNRTGHRHKHLTEEELDIRAKYFSEMRVFNEKGFSPSTTEREDTVKSDATV